MPLTFAHPAAILPLGYLPKRLVSLTALISGSVAPDFEYFLRMQVMSIYSHTLWGMLWFDVPVGLSLCFIYHQIVKKTFINNLPWFLNKRFTVYNGFDWNSYAVKHVPVVLISLIIGIASHLFWDSFTHVSGYFAILFNWVQSMHILNLKIPVYKLVQHLSTLAGGIIIFITVYRMPSEEFTGNKKVWPYWFMVAFVALLIVLVRIISGLSIYQYWNVLVTAIAGSILGIVITSIYYQTKESLSS